MESKEQLNEKDLEEEKPEDVLKALLPDQKLCEKLYPHQHEGIVFFFKAYKNGKSRAKGSRNGAILADEMGLGKSIQVILFLHGMIMNTHEFKNALLIVPAGLLNDWNDKLKRWTPNMNVLIYHRSDTELARKLRHLQTTGGILLVSYRMFINNYTTLTTYKGMHFVWDCLICDEAHKLKNPATKTHKAVALASAGFYILITGTPMQNNLGEFWSLFSLISDTYVLGTYKTFKNKFENPISKGLEADSGPKERALGMELQRTLERITEPFWIRRRKDQIQDLSGQTLRENIPSDPVLHFPKKNEYVVWIKLSSEQEAAYRKIIDNSSSLTFQAIHSLIAVCTYPRLNSYIKGHEMSRVHLAESGKLTFMLALLEWFTINGNFALVFSNYIKILDIIEKSLTQTSWGRNAFLRIDGQNSNQRDKIIRKFQKRGSRNILLLTTSVGAEGFTLTAADCVVFADLSWNQSQDAQAVGRAYRIGQTKDVKTYRLITCGTLEEMIYRRQLFKGSLTRHVVGDEKDPFRRFTQEELKAILTLQESQFSSTQQQLEKQGAKYLDIIEVFGAGINSVGVASVCGISDHGQLLSASQGEDLEVAMARMQIKETAEMCQQEIEAESHFAKHICTDVSFKKCGRKAKVRKFSHETRTPGLPRKYKCYTSSFSGRRRKNLHISRPCVLDSSDSSNLSADDEVNLSENTVPHIPVTDKSEVMGDSFNQCSTSVFMFNNTCSKDNNGLTELLQESACYDALSLSQPSSYSSPSGSYITESCPGRGLHLKSETVRNSDEDAISLLSETSDLLGKNMSYSSHSSEKRKQIAHVSRSSVSDLSNNPSISADELFSGTIVQREESDTVSYNDQDDVSLSHNVSHNNVIGDSVDLCSAATFMCNTTCSEDDDGITELLQESTYDDDSSSSSSNGSYANESFSVGSIHLNKSNTVINNDEEALNLSSEMNEEPEKNMHNSSPSHDKTKQAAHISGSFVSDLNDISSISANESFSEAIHFKQSDTVDHNDQSDVALLCNISVLSNVHGFRSGNTKQESELGEPTAFHKELIPKVVKSAEVEQQQTQVIQDETKRSRDTLEFSNHISKSHPNADLDMNVSPVTDVIKNMSFVTDLNQDMPVSHEYSSTPDKTSDSEYCSSHCDDTLNHRTSISSTRNVKYNYTFTEDNYMSKNETSNLQEASSISTNSATVSSNCTFMSDVSLVQSKESGNKQEASSQEVIFIDPMEQKLLLTDEQEETVQLKGHLSLNTHHCNDPPHSPISATSSESQEKTTLNQDQEQQQQAEDSFKTKKMSNQKIPKLCDYSLTPTCLALSIRPSVGKNTKLKQLNECSELNVLKEQTNVEDVKYIDLRGQKDMKKCEHEQKLCPKTFLDLSRQHLKLAHCSPGSSYLPSERETPLNLKDHELADLSSEASFKSWLKSKQISPVLCDYSLTPSCLALSITPSAGKEKHDTKLKQLNECSELNVLKEQTNVQEIKFTDLRGQKGLIMASERKCEYEQILFPKMFPDISKQHLNHAHPSSESSHPLTETETLWTVKDYELADLSSEGTFKSGLKSNLIAPVLCDYSLTPGCVSLLDTLSVEKENHVLSECFQSTPMQSIEVEHQETQDLWKRRLSFSHLLPGKENNCSTTLESSSEGKLCESVQLKRSEKRTPGLRQKYKCFSPSLAKTDTRKITDLDKKVEQQRTTMTGNDSSIAHSAEEHSLCPASSTYRSISTKQYESTVSSTTHEYKSGKENHDRTPEICSYSFNPSAISQSSKLQTRKITPTCLGQKQLNITEDTHIKSIQRCPTNTDTNESRLNTMLVNLLANLNTLSCNNAALRKASRRSLFKQKGQLKKKRLSLKCSRPSFSMTYRKHKKKVLESMGDVCLNHVQIEQPQGRQLNLNSIQCPENDHYYNHITDMKDIDSSLNDVPEGGSVDSIKTINVDVNADQGHYISKEHLSTSFMQFNQLPQTSTLDNHMTLQDHSKTSNSESSSHNKDDEDYDCEIEDCKNEIFRLMGDLKRL